MPTGEPTQPPIPMPTEEPTQPPTFTPTPKPTEEPTVDIKWDEIQKKLGYPRPAGNLSMFNWGLTSEAQNYYKQQYNNVMKY